MLPTIHPSPCPPSWSPCHLLLQLLHLPQPHLNVSKPVNQVQISYSTFGTKLKLKFTLAAPEFDSPEDDAFTSGTMNFQTRTQSKTFALHTFSSHLAHWINLFFTSTSFSFARLPSDFSEQELKESHLKIKLNFPDTATLRARIILKNTFEHHQWNLGAMHLVQPAATLQAAIVHL